jgi:hypothetical protein
MTAEMGVTEQEGGNRARGTNNREKQGRAEQGLTGGSSESHSALIQVRSAS